MPIENVSGAEVGWRAQGGTVPFWWVAWDGSVNEGDNQVAHGLEVLGCQLSGTQLSRWVYPWLG